MLTSLLPIVLNSIIGQHHALTLQSQSILCIFRLSTGGHINPAVTVALAIIGKFPWKKVPHYLCGQYLGAFWATIVVFGVYYRK